MSAYITVLTNLELEIENVYRLISTISKNSDDKTQIFILCRKPFRQHAIEPFLTNESEIFLYHIGEEADLSKLDCVLTEIVEEISKKIKGSLYFILDSDYYLLTNLLVVKFVRKIPEKIKYPLVHPIYIYKLQEEGSPSPDETLFFRFLDSYNYSGILGLIKQNRLDPRLSHTVNQLVKLKNFYLDNTFKLFIQQKLEEFNKNPQAGQCHSVLLEILDLSSSSQIPFIKALYYNCKIEFEQSDFADFLVRYLRLIEELLIFALGWDEDYQGKLIYCEGPKIGQVITGLKSKELSHIRDAFNQCYQKRSKFQDLYIYINSAKVNKLITIRHESIAGHGFQGVSRDVLEEVYGCGILNDLEQVIASLGINLTCNYYDVINSFLIEEYNTIKRKHKVT